MNTIIRTLTLAAPLAAAAISLAPGAAHAESPAHQPGPVLVMPTEPVDPTPKDIAVPAPKPPAPPADLANPKPKPEPEKPKDKAPVPPKNDQPEGPEVIDEITDVPDCTHGCDGDPAPDFPLDSGCFEDCDLPEEPTEGTPASTVDQPKTQPETGFATPTRVDAGLDSSIDSAAVSSDDSGTDLRFLLIGGALVTATGAAYAARIRSRQRA